MKIKCYCISILLLITSSPCAYSLEITSKHPLPGSEITTGYLSAGKEDYIAGNTHTGLDFDSGLYDDVSVKNRVFSTLPGRVVTVQSDVDNTTTKDCKTKPLSGNHVVLKHLLNSGKNVYSIYCHLFHVDGDVQGGGLLDSSFVTGNSALGFKGETGCSFGTHLHYEISNKDSAAPTGDCQSHWLPECENKVRLTPVTGSSRVYNPSPFTKGERSVLIPYMHNDENQKHTDYDVYGVTGSDISASIQIDNDSNERRNFSHLSVHGNSYHTQTSVHNFPDFETQTVDANGQKKFQSSLTLDPGDYSFKAHSDQFQDAFPIKFTVLEDDGSVIVDNDQLNDNGRSFVESSDSAEVDYTPGYYLSAKLVNGRSNASAEWHPNVSGNYDIYIHIPGEKRAVRSVNEVNGQNVVTRYQYPNEIRYRIVSNDNRDSQIVTLTINGVRDNWVQLKNPDTAT